MGAATMRVEMEISAKDLTKGGFRSAAAAADRYTKKTKNQFNDMLSAATSYRKLVSSIVAAKVLSRGFAYLEQGITDVATSIVDLDQSLTAASAKFGPEVGRGTAAFREMEQVVKDIGATTEFTAAETASGLDFLAMAGFDYAQSLKALRPLTDLATAAQMDYARASDIASDALGAFNLSTAPESIEQNLGRINDVFAATVTSSNTTMETLFDTMKLAGPVVKGGVEMFGTLAGKLGSAGIKGTIAATTLKNMFIRLQAPPREAAKALKKLDVAIDDGTGGMDSMINIIGKLNGALAGKNEIQRQKFLKDIFGMRAITGVNVLLRTGQKELQAYHDQLSNSEGAAKRMAETMRSGLGSQLKVLRSALTAKGFEIFEGLMGAQDPAEAVRELVEVVRDFDVSGIVEGLKTIGRFAKGTAEFLSENRALIKSIASVWASVSIASKIGGLVTSISDAAFGMGELATSTTTAAGSMGKLADGGGKALTIVRGFAPVITALVAGLAVGNELYKEFQRQQKATIDEENKQAMGTFGKDISGKELSYADAKKELNDAQTRWKKGRDARIRLDASARAAGQQDPNTRDLDLMTGHVSKTKALALKQEYARGLQRHIDKLARQSAESATIRNQMMGGQWQWQNPQQSEEGGFFTGQGLGMSDAARLESKGRNISGTSVQPPQVTWDPKQEFTVNVQVNGLKEGETATATVDRIPGQTITQPMSQMEDASLGAANG